MHNAAKQNTHRRGTEPEHSVSVKTVLLSVVPSISARLIPKDYYQVDSYLLKFPWSPLSRHVFAIMFCSITVPIPTFAAKQPNRRASGAIALRQTRSTGEPRQAVLTAIVLIDRRTRHVEKQIATDFTQACFGLRPWHTHIKTPSAIVHARDGAAKLLGHQTYMRTIGAR